jgi:hypothetical protein
MTVVGTDVNQSKQKNKKSLLIRNIWVDIDFPFPRMVVVDFVGISGRQLGRCLDQPRLHARITKCVLQGYYDAEWDTG